MESSLGVAEQIECTSSAFPDVAKKRSAGRQPLRARCFVDTARWNSVSPGEYHLAEVPPQELNAL